MVKLNNAMEYEVGLYTKFLITHDADDHNYVSLLINLCLMHINHAHIDTKQWI